MTTLADKVFSLMSPHFRREDTGQENDPAFQNRGTLQRIAEAFAVELDEHVLPKIEELIAKTRLPASIVDTVVPLREQSLGLPAPLYDSMTNRKWLLPYLKRCMGYRGTLRNYIFLLGRLGFDVSIETATNDGMFDSGTFDNGFFDSYLDITGTFHLTLTKRYVFPTTPLLEAEIVRIIEWNKPINVRSYTYQIVGYEPIIGLSPAALAFGVVQVGGNQTLAFDIENTGIAPLTVSSIDVPYPTYTLDWSSGVIAAESTQTVHITYTPVASGAQDGDIVINSDATLGNNVLPVTAAGFVEILTHFDGVANYLKTSVPAVALPHTSAYTISCYVRTPPAFLATYYFLGRHFDVNNCIFFQIESQKFAFGRVGGGVIQKIMGTSLILPDTLYKVDFVSEGAGHTNLKIYVNNVAYPTFDALTGTISSGTPSTVFYAGAYGGDGLPYKGDIAYMRVYGKALSSLERAAQNSGVVPLDIPELIHAWELQDAQNSATRVDSKSGATLTLFGYSPTQQAQAQRLLNGDIL